MGLAALAVSGVEFPDEDPRFADCPGLRDLVLGRLIPGALDPGPLDPGAGAAAAAARLAFWQQATGGEAAGDPALELQLARDILAQRAAATAADLYHLRGPMLSCAASTLRAAGQSRANGPTDATVRAESLDHPFRGFFAVAQARLRHRQFAGGMSGPLLREAFVATDAVTLLPYDPRRDHVLLVEQFRMGPWIRGEARPWLIEAVAGRIDAGETPEEAARREAQEEAGISVGALFHVADYYPSPGAHTEYIWSLVGLSDLPEDSSGLFGLAAEGEDIRTHVISFDAAMAWMGEGRLANAPLILSLLWLARERPALRRAAGLA
ncbi:NUDIX domain-containing protein [Pseudogemmobacter bohemicus]|uniref:NUDIX domain-containing protein n=1 Tax=Pseudogemmobacter bohemicus TaxID=2250708 RepID=UPI000DD4BB6E|nr:NUDIX domain-containing protein [Pseudogemmobacter bohemicus]